MEAAFLQDFSLPNFTTMQVDGTNETVLRHTVELKQSPSYESFPGFGVDVGTTPLAHCVTYVEVLC